MESLITFVPTPNIHIEPASQIHQEMFCHKIAAMCLFAGVVPHPEFSNLSAHNVESIGRAFYLSGQAGKIGVWWVHWFNFVPS